MSTELNSGTVGGFGHMGPNDPYNDGHSGSGSSGGSFNGGGNGGHDNRGPLGIRKLSYVKIFKLNG